MVKWDDNKVIIIAFVFVIGLILVGSFWKPTGKIFLGNNEFSLDVGNMVYVGNNNITLLNVGEGGSILVDVGGTREIITLGYDKLVNNLLIQNVDINYNDDINKRSAILKIVLATPISCTDSDGGLNYNLKGNVVYNNLTYYDYCTSGSNLAERYCSSGTVQTAYYNCPDWVYGMCYDGACLVNTTMTTTSTSTTTTPLSQSCIDSDGNNLNIGGYVYFDPHNATTGTYYDYCYSNNQYVQEYVCGIGLNGGYYISGGGYYCPRGCQDGACVDFSCTDSDVTPEFPDGRNWYLVGTVTDNREDPPTNEDYCYYNDYDYYSYQLFEHYCEADGYSSVLHTCPNSCQDGACFTCEDSDGGLNPYVYGEVNEDPNWPPWQDVCEDENTLMEATCGGSGQGPANFSRIPCYRGCQDGACIGIPPVCLDTDWGIRKYSFGNTTGRAEENSENVISEIDYCINFVTNESLLSCG